MSDRDCWIFTKRDCCRFVMSRAFLTCTRGLKVSVAFWLSCGFYTVTVLRPCQLLYYVSWLLHYWSLQFVFFVLTSGRPLPVTTFCLFEATLQPRSWFGNFLHRCNSAVYCSIMWYSFIHSSLQLKFMLMIYVLSHRIFSVLFSSSKNLAIFAWTFDPAFLLRSESLN